MSNVEKSVQYICQMSGTQLNSALSVISFMLIIFFLQMFHIYLPGIIVSYHLETLYMSLVNLMRGNVM